MIPYLLWLHFIRKCSALKDGIKSNWKVGKWFVFQQTSWEQMTKRHTIAHVLDRFFLTAGVILQLFNSDFMEHFEIQLSGVPRNFWLGGPRKWFPPTNECEFLGPALEPLAGCRGGMGLCRGSRYLATFTSKMTANLKQDLANLQIFALPNTLRQHKSLCGWGPYKKIQRHVLTRAIDKIQE